MKIGVIYEITGNPYFGDTTVKYSTHISEYVYPSEINDICQALTELGHTYEIIDGPLGLLQHINNGQRCDLYFNKSIGFHGLERKIAVPAIALIYGLPIIGSNAYTMTLARHKYHTNRLLYGMGFNVPWAKCIYNINDLDQLEYPFPVIVKPNEESDSLGISELSVCHSKNEVYKITNYLLSTFKQPVVIEEFIDGEEWKFSIIGNGDNVHVYGGVNSLKNGIPMIGTLQTRDDILNNTLSYTGIPHNSKYKKVCLLAESIHRLIGLKDYSRCDFRLRGDDIFCMEVSTHPFISNSEQYSSFVAAAKQELMDYKYIIDKIIRVSHERNTF